MPRRHQQRALALMRAAESRTRIETEVAIPESSRWIDALFDGGRPSAAWGVIQGDLAERQVVFEHFSAPPPGRRLASTLIKAAWAFERWSGMGRRAGRRPPLALVVSVGRPALGLSLLGFRPEPLTGLYRARLGVLELLAVDVRGLPPVRGTAFLRAFDHRPSVASHNLLRLFHDPDLSRRVKLAIGAAIMKEPALWDPKEHTLTAEELYALGELTQTRRLVERALTKRLGRLSRALAEALGSCRDRARLERIHDLALSEPDRATLRRAALGLLTAPAPTRRRGPKR